MGLKKTLIMLLMLCSLSGVAQAAFKLRLSDTQVQSALESYFPIKEYEAITKVKLQKPTVELRKSNKNIVLMIPVDATIIGDAIYSGHIVVPVDLNYKAASGVLYLSNPRIDKFEMPGVSKKMLKELYDFIETIVNNSLPLVRIYKLKEQDVNHSLPKSALKKVHVEDHQLRLEFGFK